VSAAALAETAEAIKKLVALGALDPAVATMGAGPALPSSRPVLPKLEPLRQDGPPPEGAGGGATKPASAPSGPSEPLEPTPSRELTLRPDNVEDVIATLNKRHRLSAHEIKLIRHAAKTNNEKWNLPDTLRGKVSHALAGENLLPNTQTIDRVGAIRPDRVATEVASLKSHQLYARSMRAPGGTLATLKQDIDALAKLQDQKFLRENRVPFLVNTETKRILQVEVPRRTLRHVPGETAAEARLRAQFIEECEQARTYAKTLGIELRFVEAIK
jgi:hypothetical protein